MTKRRAATGSTILETGPSLLILAVVIFALLDLAVLGMQYGAGWYLNSMSAHEVACLRHYNPTTGADNWQPALNQQSTNFCASGVGQFLHLTTAQITQAATDLTGATPPAVQVNTTLPIRPLIPVPMPFEVPGLNAAFNVSYITIREREDTR